MLTYHPFLCQSLHPGTQLLHQGTVMTDDDQPQVALLRLIQQEGPDLGLGDKVQHGADLVAQQIAHSGPQGTGDAEPLEFTAR